MQGPSGRRAAAGRSTPYGTADLHADFKEREREREREKERKRQIESEPERGPEQQEAKR